MPAEVVIEVNNLTRVYSAGEVEVKALRGVSFSICKGEFDHVAEQAFFNVGPITDVEEKWAQLQKENG